MGRFLRDNKVLVLAFVILLAAAVFFAVGAFRKARDFDVAKEQPVASWMTPRFVAHSWGVPRDVMMTILGLEAPGPGRQTVAEIADERGVPVEALIAEIEAGIAAFRAERGQ